MFERTACCRQQDSGGTLAWAGETPASLCRRPDELLSFTSSKTGKLSCEGQAVALSKQSALMRSEQARVGKKWLFRPVLLRSDMTSMANPAASRLRAEVRRGVTVCILLAWC